MFFKCLLLLFITDCIGIINGEFKSTFGRSSLLCRQPGLENGRVRIRQRSKLIKFICYPRYELVGNRYATCTLGHWDTPAPVCVRPGCDEISLSNGIIIYSHSNAWANVFCMPDYELVGSPVMYCDGYAWNSTTPKCITTKTKPPTSCDFEKDLCGWTQDDLHDFDWIRWSYGLSRSILYTGPQYDHTLGPGKSGYFMYIESMQRTVNDTARLLSPIYDASIVNGSCFSFYYHVCGIGIGALRVYQKPDSINLYKMLNFTGAEMDKYLLFEKWHDQGNIWYRAAPLLRDFSEDFQIIIEGIRGMSYINDIAIDDVAILSGDNCTLTGTDQDSTKFQAYSCAGRCRLKEEVSYENRVYCTCDSDCIMNSTCCPDFFDMCFRDLMATDDDVDTTTSDVMPQTEKLIAITDHTTTTTVRTTPSTTTTTSVETTKAKTTVLPTTVKFQPTKPPSTRVIATKSTAANVTVTIRPVPSSPASTTVLKSSTAKISVSPTNATTKTTPTKSTTPLPYGISRTIENHNVYNDLVEQKKKEEKILIEAQLNNAKKTEHTSSGFATASACVAALCACVIIAWGARQALRSRRGVAALAGLRARVAGEPDVRYLIHDVDE